MSGCTLRFTRDSPLRTTLVDAATGNVKYQIDTPMRIAGSVTRIRKFDSSTQPPLQLGNIADSDYGGDVTDMGGKRKKDTCDDITDKGRKKKSVSDDITNKGKKRKSKKEKKKDAGAEIHGTSDEIARIYWKWFSSDKIIFRGRIYLRTQFLPKCGKMKG